MVILIDTYSYKSGGYTYIVTIDTSKEDPEQTRKRYNTMDFFFKWNENCIYITYFCYRDYRRVF